MDQEKSRDVNEAARRFAETLAESYRLVYGQAAEAGQRQQQRAQEFSDLVAQNLREQAEGNQAAARRLSEQASRQQQAGQDLARESVEAYAEFLNTAFAQYRAGTERAAEGARNLAATTTSAVGTAAGATTGAVGEATDTAAEATRSAAETATFPIPGYDGMNVEEISGRLGSLTEDQIRQLRDYERENQNRKTLMEGYEAKLRASS